MPAPAKAQDPIKNKLKQKGLGSVAQVIEVLSSITSITKKKKKRERQIGTNKARLRRLL
jgi:hypothetical protein